MRSAAQFRAKYDQLACSYLAFLLAYDARRAERWLADVTSEQPEGHLFEATVWRALVAIGVLVRPLPEGARGVDFACVGPTGARFYVEARGRLALSLGASTGIEDGDEPKGGCFETPAKDVCELVRSKEAQASRHEDAPVLVVVGSLHRWAGLVLAPHELGFLEEVAASSHVVRWADPHTGVGLSRVVAADHYAFADAPSVGGLVWLSSQATWAIAPDSSLAYRLTGLINHEALRPFDPAALPLVRWVDAGE